MIKPIAVKLTGLLIAACILAEPETSETDLTADMDEEIMVLEPVVVTGYLWESELQKVTASVSVLDEQQLELNGVQHFEDIVNTIPNVTWTGGNSRPRFIQIRGIGENSQFEGETPDSAVRFLIDDFDLTGVGTVGNLFDVSQVEVLRGPQAGAFGVNAAGGVVKIVTNDPTPFWTGQAEHTIGNDDLLEAGVAVGGPILESDPEQLTFRFSIHNLAQNGFRRNRTLDRDDTNERDELTSRLKVRWLPNEDWQLDGSLLYADFDNGYDEFTLNNSRTSTFSDEPGQDEQETKGASFKAAYSGFDEVDILYISQYTDTNSLYSYDSDWGAGELAAPPLTSTYTGNLTIDREREVFSEEIRIHSSETEDALGLIDRWTIGSYYHGLEENTNIDYNEASIAFAYSGNVTAESVYETETFALFGQAAHDFTKSTRIVLGLRYENHSVDFQSLTTNDTLGYIADPSKIISSQDDDLWGGKLTLEHDILDTHMIFASITRGYKAAGANSGTFNDPGDPLTYDTEILWNYEIGLHSRWFNNQVSSKVVVFYLDRKDAQLRDSAGAGGFFRYFTSNAGDAEHYGLETETTWHINKNWTVTSSLGLLETELDNSGDDVSNSPSYTYTTRLNYRSAKGLFAGIEAVGRDDYFESNSHNEKRDAYELVNSSIGYRWDQWTVTLWVKNLFDEEYAERVFFFNNTDFSDVDTRYEAPAAPQTFGVTANYSW